MSPEDEVRQTSERYYEALGSLLGGDAGPLVQVWSQSQNVTAMNPYGGREVGWEQLRPAFERVAQMCLGSRASVWLQDRRIQVGGDIAYETGIESGEGVILGKPTTISQRVTNIYRREASGWKMVHRHADLNPSEIRLLAGSTAKKHEIDALASDFFSAVSFLEGKQPAYDRLYALFAEGGKLMKTSASVPEVSTVRQFIESRQRLIDAGELTRFREMEIAEITEMFGNVAHRLSTYEKYGVNRGVEFAGRGAISMQFILTDAGWRISAMAWDDERPGLTLPDRYQIRVLKGEGTQDA